MSAPRIKDSSVIPRFIVFEGIDGSGKSTQARLLTSHLQAAGLACLLTAEPSDGPFGAVIRALPTRPDPEEEARLFLLDRRDHVQRVIGPALDAGTIVICDRYIHSSLAYQGARRVDPKKLRSAHDDFLIPPDVVFLLLVPVDEALNRIRRHRDSGLSIFEIEENLTAVDALYRSFNDPCIRRVDATGSPEETQRAIRTVLGLS